MNIRQYLLAGSTWAFAMRIVGAACNLLIAALLTRLLSVEHVGVYFFLFTLVTIASTIGRFGLGATSIRLLADALAKDQHGRVAALLQKLALLGVISSSTVALLYLLVVTFADGHLAGIPDALSALAPWIALWMVAMSLRLLAGSMFRGLHAIRMAALFNGTLSALVSVTLLAGIYSVSPAVELSIAVIVMVIGNLSALGIGSALLFRKWRSYRPAVTVSNNSILRIASPLFLTSLFGLLLNNGDIILLGIVGTAEETAFYAAAMRLIAVAILPATVLTTVISPLIARYYAHDKNAEMERLLRLASTLTVIPALLLFLLFYVGDQSLVRLIFGSEYGSSYQILMILLVGYTIGTSCGAGQQLMIMTGNERSLLNCWLVSGVLSLLYAWMSIDEYGAIGVAFSFSFGHAFLNLLIVLVAWKLTGVKSFILMPHEILRKENLVLARSELARFRARGKRSAKHDGE